MQLSTRVTVTSPAALAAESAVPLFYFCCGGFDILFRNLPKDIFGHKRHASGFPTSFFTIFSMI